MVGSLSFRLCIFGGEGSDDKDLRDLRLMPMVIGTGVGGYHPDRHDSTVTVETTSNHSDLYS